MNSVTQNVDVIQGKEIRESVQAFAHFLITRGFKIFPVVPNGKRPCIVKSWPAEATDDPRIVAGWWDHTPDANIGLPTGEINGVVVVDIDNGGNKNGSAELKKLLEEHGDSWAHVPYVKTPSGGYHFFFKHPGVHISSSANKIAPGIDIRADGGYVVAIGSYRNGKPYEGSSNFTGGIENPPEMPEWLMKLIEKLNDRAAVNRKIEVRGRVWEEYLIGGTIRGGGRNNYLFEKVASPMRGRGAGFEDIFATLQAVYEKRCEKTEPMSAKELENIAWSVVKRYEPNKRVKKMRDPLHFSFSDLGNAERLVDRYGVDLRFCNEFNKWFVWDGTRWIEDNSRAVQRMAHETIRKLKERVKELPNDEENRKQAEAWARTSENRSRVDAMIEMAKSLEGIPAMAEDFDNCPYLINFRNGTLDVRTGEFREHRREDMITMMVPVDYQHDAQAPRFKEFLNTTFQGDIEIIEYLQKAFGYALTGDVSEDKVHVFYGGGRNGKSTLINTILAAFGDYGKVTPAETLMEQRGGGVPNDIARLKGARFVAASETARNRRLDAAKIKQMSGGDRQVARFMRGEFFEFTPQYKIFLVTNHKPKVDAQDDAIWRRLVLVPFEYKIPEDQLDKHLEEKLLQELPGILAWVIEGAIKWYKEGLNPPDSVRLATNEYRDEMDIVRKFIKECCQTGPDFKAKASDLYANFKSWAEENEEDVMNIKEFAQTMGDNGFTKKRTKNGNVWVGLELTR
jgi:putative DNA primase/helicase